MIQSDEHLIYGETGYILSDAGKIINCVEWEYAFKKLLPYREYSLI